jgi:hypothetical protein
MSDASTVIAILAIIALQLSVLLMGCSSVLRRLAAILQELRKD